MVPSTVSEAVPISFALLSFLSSPSLSPRVSYLFGSPIAFSFGESRCVIPEAEHRWSFGLHFLFVHVVSDFRKLRAYLVVFEDIERGVKCFLTEGSEYNWLRHRRLAVSWTGGFIDLIPSYFRCGWGLDLLEVFEQKLPYE